MEIKQEFYSESYEPKLDKDKYAYYVDASNSALMRRILNNFINVNNIDPKGYNDNMRSFDHFMKIRPVIMYFIDNYASYSPSPTQSYAVKHNYTIINVQERCVMKFD